MIEINNKISNKRKEKGKEAIGFIVKKLQIKIKFEKKVVKVNKRTTIKIVILLMKNN